MNTKLKKVVALMLLAVMLLSMTACSIGGSEQITIKGCFVLEPNEEYFKEKFDEDEGLGSTLEYFFVIYDVTPKQNTEINGDISLGDYLKKNYTQVNLTLNNNNVYEDISSAEKNGIYLNSFLQSCGYANISKEMTIYSNDGNTRMVSVFAVNKNDISENTKGKIEIKLSKNLKETKKIAAADIKTIDYMDGVFAVEDDPETYMLKCSLKAQSDAAYDLINICCTYANSFSYLANNIESAVSIYNGVTTMYGEHSTILMSAASSDDKLIMMTMDDSHFTIDEIRERFPDVADEIEKIREADAELRSGKASGDEIYTAFKNAFYSVRTSISNIQDDIEKYY